MERIFSKKEYNFNVFQSMIFTEFIVQNLEFQLKYCNSLLNSFEYVSKKDKKKIEFTLLRQGGKFKDFYTKLESVKNSTIDSQTILLNFLQKLIKNYSMALSEIKVYTPDTLEDLETSVLYNSPLNSLNV